MAEIPVEKKEGGAFPWWLIPLILLLLLLPLLYFCSKRDTTVVTNTNGNTNGNTMTNANRSGAMMNGSANSAMTGANGGIGSNTAVVVNSNGGNMSAGAGSSGAAVTDVNMFGTTTDKATLVGRSTTLSGVRVNRVLSDKVFTVKSGAGEMFVMLDDALDSAGGKEKQIKMQHGQNVNIGGTFRNVPTGETSEEHKEGGLNKNEYAQMKGQNVYLHATSVSDVK